MAWNINDARNTEKNRRINEDTPSLSNEAKDAREASGELDTGNLVNKNTDLASAILQIERIVGDYTESNQKLSTELKQAVKTAEAAMARVNEVSTFVTDNKNAMQDAILAGTTDAVREASERAKREIKTTAKEAQEHILTLERESRVRTDKLNKATLSNKFFRVLKATLLIVLLIISISYLVQMYL